MRTLAIDDVRNLPATHTARTFAAGMWSLVHEGPWEGLFLDHDLASYGPDGTEQTGYHVILYMEEHPEVRPKRVKLVTDNSVGLAKMAAGLLAMGYIKKSDRVFDLA